MCSSKLKLEETSSFDINGRPVLQPTCNRVPLLERRNSLKKNFTKSVITPRIQPSTITTTTNVSPKFRPTVIIPPISPKLKSPRQPAIKRGNDPNGLSSSSEKVVMTPTSTIKVVTPVKESKKSAPSVDTTTLNYSSSSIVEAPGSIAAARREQVANMQVQRKLKIAHYGKLLNMEEQSLKKRQEFREAFSEFDAETVSKFSEKKITSISTKYSIAVSQIRGIVDNAKRILQMKKDFGSFDKYLWGFVNHKPIVTQYKSSHKMPVKTSKAETISKDMVKKGFRLVGPTVIHSFMQAAGFTNDHLTNCPQHLQCLALASHSGTPVAALQDYIIY